MPPTKASTPWSAMLTATFGKHSDAMLKLFASGAIDNIPSLLAAHASFMRGAPDEDDLKQLAITLHGVGAIDGVMWPDPATKDTTSLLKQLVQDAHKAMMPAAPALPAQPAAAGPAAPAAPTAAARNAQVGGDAYAIAAKVHATKYAGSTRIKYEMVGKLQDGFKSRKPVAYALGEYGLELAVKAARTESYTHLGVTFVAQDAYEKPTVINTWELLFQQMQRRAQAKAVAGCFSVAAEARARGLPAPMLDQVIGESTIQYVDSDGAVPRAMEMDCFATVSGMLQELAAMMELHRAQPHVSIDQLIQIDTKVQAKQADYLMDGYTLDAAVMRTCKKSPELYSTAMLHTESAEDASAEAGKGGEATGKSKRKADRSEAEELAAVRRQVENKEKQIENLKNGKRGGKGGWQQGGKGGGWQQGGWQQGGKGGWAFPPPAPFAWQGGKGAGPPGGGGGAAICQDFNYKVSGCSRPNCKFLHTCSQCGANHPFKGNH